MKREALLVFVALVGLLAASFVAGKRWDVSPPAAVCPAAPEKPDAAVVDGLQACTDGRLADSLNYIKWRGKHIVQLEACTDSLGEATRALTHRKRP